MKAALCLIISYYDFKLYENKLFPWLNEKSNQVSKTEHSSLESTYVSNGTPTKWDSSSISGGTIIKIGNNYYVLTTATQIRDSIINYLLFKNKQINLEIYTLTNEFNLALLKIINHIPEKYITIHDFNIRLIDDVKGYLYTNIDQKNKQIKCKLCEIIIDKLINIHIPDNVFIQYNISSDINIKKGSIIVNSNKKINGIVYEQTDDIIYAIPSKVICRFLQEMSIDNRFEICSLYFDHIIINNELMVTNTNKINYNTSVTPNLLQNEIIPTRYNNFRKNDVILEIDNTSLKNGKVYDQSIGINLPLKTYIMLNYFMGMHINFKIMRIKDDIYITKNIMVNIRPASSIFLIPYKNSFQTKYYIVDNKIYIELDENIIRYFIKQKINIDDIMNIFMKHNIRNDVTKKCYGLINLDNKMEPIKLVIRMDKKIVDLDFAKK